MADLPGYDDWKTHNPDDDRCEFCGVHPTVLQVGKADLHWNVVTVGDLRAARSFLAKLGG